jgi:hypothetical protein
VRRERGHVPRFVVQLPAIAMRELEDCCRAGLTAEKTKVRLGEVGVWMSVRTVARRIDQHRKETRAREERVFALREIGRGMASLNAGIGVACEIAGAAIPDWRGLHLTLLQESFRDFISKPTEAGLSAIVTGSLTYLVTASLYGHKDQPVYFENPSTFGLGPAAKEKAQ